MTMQTTTVPRPFRWLAGLTLIFALVHAGYFLAGVRFNDKTLIEVMHFIDPELLKTRLVESLWYLHIQPPLFNLLTGLVLKITPESSWLFQAIFTVCGAVLYLNVFLLQVELGVRRWLAAALAILFMASPSFILWEQYLLYTMPIATLLSASALCLLQYLRRHNTRHLAGFFGCTTLLCGFASMFHLGYFVVTAGGLLAACRGHRRQILVAAALPFLMVVGFYCKNLLLFGEFNVCTFAEKNLWIMTAGNMPWDEKTALVNEGKLSPLSLVNRWASLDAYPATFKEVPERFRDIPVLARTHKSNGSVNYNHYGYIANCHVYGADAKYVLVHRPWHFIVSTLQSWYRYFKSSSDLPVSPENQARMRPMLWLYDHLIYGKSPVDLSPYSRFVEKTNSQPCFFLLIGLPIVWGFGLYRAWRPHFRLFHTPERVALIFMAFAILMVAVLGCSLDYLETARYRFTTDGLSIALLGILIEDIMRQSSMRAKIAG